MNLPTGRRLTGRPLPGRPPPEAAPERRPHPGRAALIVIAGLYVAQAIPLYLVAAAFPPILRARGADLTLIGGLGILLAPWALKFLWAPVVDRFGSRRTWVLATQAIALVIIARLAFLDPVADLAAFFPLLMALSICAATQDIAADAYAVERLTPERHAVASAIQSGSVAIGVLLGGSLTLFVYDAAGWRVAVLGAAAMAALATAPMAFFGARASARAEVPARRRPSFRAFWARREMRGLLAFALIFRLPEGLVKAVEQAFLVDVGFTLTRIGVISGASAACVGLVGAALGAWIIAAIGLTPFFWAVVTTRSLCFAGYAFAAYAGASDPALIALSALNTFSRYMEIVGLYTAFLRFSSLNQAGTDFTILASANLATYTIGSMAAGALAAAFGYGPLFTLAAALSVVAGGASLALAPRFSCAPPPAQDWKFS